tara:strand:- start:441 stop:668 length:228 start_codon:yes stop_codon:yes gene_type:complete
MGVTLQGYKVECIPIREQHPVLQTFTLFFEKEEYMFDFMEIVPDTYMTKHYEKSKKGGWTLIAEIDGWRKCIKDD